jgi:hypothetical protein
MPSAALVRPTGTPTCPKCARADFPRPLAFFPHFPRENALGGNFSRAKLAGARDGMPSAALVRPTGTPTCPKCARADFPRSLAFFPHFPRENARRSSFFRKVVAFEFKAQIIVSKRGSVRAIVFGEGSLGVQPSDPSRRKLSHILLVPFDARIHTSYKSFGTHIYENQSSTQVPIPDLGGVASF